MQRRPLFLDGEDVDEAHESGLRVNTSYAKRYEEKKKREEMSRLAEKYADQLDESSSDEDEDEDAMLLTEGLDAKIAETLEAIQKKDPRVYDSSVKFFDDDSQADGSKDDNAEAARAKSGAAAMSLREYQSRMLLEHGPEEIDSDEEARRAVAAARRTRGAGLAAVTAGNEDEDEALRQAFRASGNGNNNDGDDDDDDLLRKREVNPQQQAEFEHKHKEWREDVTARKRTALSRYFGPEDKLSEQDRFLRDYVLNQQWIDPTSKRMPTYNEIVGRDESDLEDHDRVDDFERELNFRFEEDGGAELVTHARHVEGSVRRKNEARKLARKQRQERKEQEKQQKQQELLRLKKLKKQEILQRLQKLQQITGNAKIDVDLEGDFDPDAYDKQMAAMFDDEFYDAEDPDFKPSAEDANDDEVREIEREAKKVDHLRRDRPDDDGNDDDEGDDAEDGGDGGQSYADGDAEDPVDEEAVAAEKKRLDEYLEQYYKLDYEDIIGGDMPVRFKYHEVKPNNFGMSVDEILEADDKELKQYVPIKKLAPYREKEYKVPYAQRREWKRQRETRLAELEKERQRKREKKQRRRDRQRQRDGESNADAHAEVPASEQSQWDDVSGGGSDGATLAQESNDKRSSKKRKRDDTDQEAAAGEAAKAKKKAKKEKQEGKKQKATDASKKTKEKSKKVKKNKSSNGTDQDQDRGISSRRMASYDFK